MGYSVDGSFSCLNYRRPPPSPNKYLPSFTEFIISARHGAKGGEGGVGTAEQFNCVKPANYGGISQRQGAGYLDN